MNHSRFDIEIYGQSKLQINQMIKASHKWETTEGFIEDGVICPQIYEKQPLRILCILAESYGYDQAGSVDIESQLTEDVLGLGNSGVKTPRHLAAFLWILQRSIKNRQKAPKNEWEALESFPQFLKINSENLESFQGALSKVAWINVKKASNGNGSELDAEEAHAHALRNRDILHEQIIAINPQLILVGGQTAFRSLHEIGLLGSEIELAKKWQLQYGADGRAVIEVTHPRYLADWGGYTNLYRTFEVVYDEIVKWEPSFSAAN